MATLEDEDRIAVNDLVNVRGILVVLYERHENIIETVKDIAYDSKSRHHIQEEQYTNTCIHEEYE